MILARRGLTSRPILAVTFVILGGILPARGADGPISPRTAVRGLSDPPSLSPAERLVREALAAELAGDNVRRDELLSQALEEDPNCRLARWQSGFVSVSEHWLTPEQVAKGLASDRTLAEYRRRRDVAASAGLFTRGDFNASASRPNDDRRKTSNTSVELYRSDALTPAGIAAHAELACWCRKNRLGDEERAHWTQVLLEQPGNQEAEARLGLKWFAGGLYTYAQIESLKQQRAAELKQWRDWKPTVLRWKEMLDSGTASNRDQAAAEMNEVKDPTIIPALEWIDASDSAKPPLSRDTATPFQREAIALIGRIPQQRATYSLVLHSVRLRQSEARAAAANELKKRPLHDFVPILLAGLANPIQFDWWAAFDPTVGLATYRASLSQETQDKIIKIEYSDTMTGLVPAGGNLVARTTTWVDVAHVSPDLVRSQRARDPTTLPGAKVTTSRTTTSDSPRPMQPRGLSSVPGATALANRTASLGESINEWNAKHEQINQCIVEVLKRTTMRSSAGENDDSDESDVIPNSASAKPATATADYWWDWWAGYNETPSPTKQIDVRRYARESFANPDRYSTMGAQASTQMYNSTTGQLVGPPPPPPSSSHSCFAAGTLVATAIGPVAIEGIRCGDRVLAQNADTGELAYKPVLETSKSPPSKLLRITTTRGAVRLTLGHPFWLEGKGWRMAKELAVGDRIHCLGGSALVTGIESLSGEPVYNLNVADFGTYFVGNGHLLVHDFTPRLPTPAAIPGYVADAR
jgi:hypothetical protein